MGLKKIIVLVFGFLLTHSLIAQNANCQVTESISNGRLAVEFVNRKIESNIFGAVQAYFKMPWSSGEVNEVDWVNCEGYLPSGAKIKSIEIVSVAGLPEGLDWYCDKDNGYYEGGETGCITFAGTARKKGNYTITIKLKGVGSLFGIKKSYDCLITTYDIIVE